MNHSIHAHIHVVTCGSLAQEMRQVAHQTGRDFVMKVFPAICHRNPGSLGKHIEQYVVQHSRNARIFIAYGRCCETSLGVSDDIYWLPAYNCAAILLGGNARYEELGNSSFFLTPHLALTWKQYFLGREDARLDGRTQSKLGKWFRPISRLVQIDMDSASSNIESKSAEELSSIIHKPLIRVKGDLQFLRDEYRNFCGKV